MTILPTEHTRSKLMEAGMETEGGGPELSRRQVLSTAGLAAMTVPFATRRHAPALVRRPDVAGAPGPEQAHVQFGARKSLGMEPRGDQLAGATTTR